MNTHRLGALALMFGFLAGPAMAQDVAVATAGSMTGPYAAFGRQLRTKAA